MAVSQKLPAPQQPADALEECDSGYSISYSSASDVEIDSTTSTLVEDDAFNNGATTMSRGTPASLKVPPTCCKKTRSMICGDAAAPNSIARLHQHLVSLRSLLPPSARFSRTRDVVADALLYKKVLRKQIQILQKALPYAQQVNVKRLGSGGLQIGVFCKKEPGLLVALMEAIESFGLAFANVNVSCLDEKIRIDAIGDMEISERIGSLKVALMATIMRFSRQQSC
ncbi:hypothetical protein L7F22_004243 [Adiantum nelumboides]|nr:hypothetical protein [Adiantum nelumboides]